MTPREQARQIVLLIFLVVFVVVGLWVTKIKLDWAIAHDMPWWMMLQ